MNKQGGWDMKCKFRKICKWYDEESRVCNISGGMYYADETEPAGCWREMEIKRLKDKMEKKDEN